MSEPDDDVQAWLDGLSGKVRRRLSSIIKQEADQLSAAQLAALRSFERPPAETGDLEASCRVEPGRNEAEFIVAAGGDQTMRDGYDHALAFEFGTVHQEAQPFFYPTYRERAEGIRQIIEEAVGEALKS